MKTLRIALLLDGRQTDAYVPLLCEWAAGQPGIDIVLAVVLPRPGGQDGPAPRSWRHTVGQAHHRMLFRGVLLTERLLLSCYKAHRAHLEAADLARVAAAHGFPVRTLVPELRAGEDTVTDDELAEWDIDLFLPFGAAEPAAATLAASRLGALAIDYRRGASTGSAPIGFWESYHGRSKTGFSVVALGGPQQAARVLLEGAFRTKYSFLLNQAHLFRHAQAQLRRLLLDTRSTGRLPPPRDTVPYSGKCLAPPDCAESAAYLVKVLGRLGAKAWRRALGIQDKWTLSVTHSAWRDAKLWRGVPVPAPPGHFYADPFLRIHGGRTYCFVEDYVYATRRAHISVLEIAGSEVRYVGAALKEDFHLSFPFLFEYRGELFMCPEASGSNQIRIYRCEEFPLRWTLHALAMDNISAADSMFFEHGGKWWMLTSVDRAGLADHCSELCLYHADDPLAGRWTPHPRNPLCIDSDMGRNAGLIVDGGRIYRAAQRQGFDQYGEGLALYEILVLNEHDYLERKLTDIRHDYLERSLGSHHISSAGNVTVVDYKTHCFAP